MKLEEAIPYLRKGFAICRKDRPDCFLEGTLDEPMGSFYLTLWDVLEEDWEFYKYEIHNLPKSE